VLVALRSQSRLRLEGRTHTLSGPSPDLDLGPHVMAIHQLPIQFGYLLFALSGAVQS